MKTGTSAIQDFIRNNQKLLLDNNFFFPPTNEKAMNYLGFSLLDQMPPFIHTKLDIKTDQLYKNLINEINNCKKDNIIISTEAFSLISTSYFLGEEAPRKLLEYFKNNKYTFTIIAFIRRQDDYLETQYNQHVKTHNFWSLYTKDINSFYLEKKELLQFGLILDRWSKYFGKENVKVCVYDNKKDSVSEFLKILKLKIKIPLNNPDKINKKLSPKALEFMKTANGFDILKNTAEQNYKLVEIIESSLGNGEDSSYLLSSIEAKKILKDFENENMELSKTYLEEDMSWFKFEERKHTEILNKEVLTKEESIKIATSIWNHFQKK